MPHTYKFESVPETLITDGASNFTSLESVNASHDCSLLIVNDDFEALRDCRLLDFDAVNAYASHDESILRRSEAFFMLSKTGKKVIVSPTGPLNRDYDDVRRYGEAAKRAVKRMKALKEVKNPIFVIQNPPPALSTEYSEFLKVSALAALAELNEPLEAREAMEFDCIKSVTVTPTFSQASSSTYAADSKLVVAIETGRRLSRDIGGGDPERMSSIGAAVAIETFFKNYPAISLEIIKDMDFIKREYPLFSAVARATECVPRHAPRIVRLQYKSPNQSKVKEELFMVGKGINYDTGGADLKVHGLMAGMSRDKCGAASLAGFMAACAILQPEHINLSIDLAFVRNSIGPDSYVPDEIIRSRAGLRVRIGNTDAEGRMAMCDLLAHQKERVLELAHPERARLFTCATLTGHVCLAYGPYGALCDNGPARKVGVSAKIRAHGEAIGDCFEFSTIRRDDFDFIAPESNREDVIQANTKASSSTPRGHQYPAAFLTIASGLAKHGLDSEIPLPYTHMDIAGSACEGPGMLGPVTGTPIPALAKAFLQ